MYREYVTPVSGHYLSVARCVVLHIAARCQRFQGCTAPPAGDRWSSSEHRGVPAGRAASAASVVETPLVKAGRGYGGRRAASAPGGFDTPRRCAPFPAQPTATALRWSTS